MERKNESRLAHQFDNLYAALGRIPNGPPDDLAGLLREPPPVAELPPPSMTFLLIAVVHFLHGCRRLRMWLPECLSRLEAPGMRDDVDFPQALIAKLEFVLDGLHWTVDIGIGPHNYQESCLYIYNESYKHNNSRDFICQYQNSSSLVHLIEHNRQDPVLARLYQFPEMGIETREKYELTPKYHKLQNAMIRDGSRECLPARAIWELGDSGVLAIQDHRDGMPWIGLNEGSPFFRLGDAAQAHAHLLDEFRVRWGDPAMRPRLAALIGDWEFAEAAAAASGLDELAASMLPRVEQCRRDSLAALRRRIVDSDSEGYCIPTIRALLEVELEDLPKLDWSRCYVRTDLAGAPACFVARPLSR